MDQLDLAVAVRSDRVAGEDHATNAVTFAKHRNSDDRPRLGEPSHERSLEPRVLLHVRDVHGPALAERDAHHAAADPYRDPPTTQVAPASLLGELLANVLRECRAVRDRHELVALGARQPADVRANESHGVVEHDVEDRLEVEHRAADRLQHFGHRGLPLERFPRLIEETHVLDRDGGLIRERAQELYLPVGERLHRRAPECDRSERDAFSEHRCRQDRPLSHLTRATNPGRVLLFGLGQHVLDMHHAALDDRSPAYGTSIHRPGRQCAAHRSVVGDLLEEAIRAHQRDAAVLSGAEARRVPSDRVEHWLTIGRGACHRAQHVTERGLPLERLLRLVE